MAEYILGNKNSLVIKIASPGVRLAFKS
jgi:hypothetical protein